MANVIINDAYLTDIAGAIREKSGSTATYKPKEMATAIYALPTGGSTVVDDLSKQILARTLSGEVSLSCDTIGDYALSYMKQMTSFTGDAKTIGNRAFIENDRLTTVILPNATHIGTSAFALAGLRSVSIPKIVSIGTSAFSTSLLSKVDLGYSISKIYGHAFYNCTFLKAVIIRASAVPNVPENLPPFPVTFYKTYTGTEPGYIYVPRAMIPAYEAYQANPYSSNPGYDWWTMLNYRAIEDYPDICG